MLVHPILDRIVSLVDHHANATVEDQRDRNEAGKEIQSLLAGLVRDEGGVTEAVLSLVDALYGKPGLKVTWLAPALGMQHHELREKLGKSQKFDCTSCGLPLMIILPRTKSGYAPVSSVDNRCGLCIQFEREHNRRKSAALKAESRIIAGILQQLESESVHNVLELSPELRTLCHHHVMSWSGGPETPVEDLAGCGCVVCARRPVTMWIRHDEVLGRSDLSDHARALPESLARLPGSLRLPQELRIGHLLVILESERLWRECMRLPLTESPLVFVCEIHAYLASGTHRRLRTGFWEAGTEEQLAL